MMQVLKGPIADMSQQVLSLAGNGQILVDFQSLDSSFTVPEFDGASPLPKKAWKISKALPV
jgi:hypothetical protein